MNHSNENNLKKSISCKKVASTNKRLVLFMIFIFGLPLSVSAATFVVNNLGDAPDAHPGDGIAATSGGVATLRAAIEEASFAVDSDEITFDPAIFSSEQTINLGSRIRPNYTITITGPGADLLTISGQDACQIFRIYEGATITMTGLTLAHGYATLASGDYAGGAIYTEDDATVHISECSFENNYGEFEGGACLVTGIIDFNFCAFSNNTTNTSGGAIFFPNNTIATLYYCSFSSNSAPFNAGGGIAVSESDIYIYGSLFANNTASEGGGITFYGTKSMTISNCTILGNIVEGYGGGIATFGPTLMSNCTVISNEANTVQYGLTGGGIFLDPTGSLQIGNTIVSGNSDNDTTGQDVSGTVTSLGGNLIGIGDGSIGFTGTNDQVGTTASPIDAKLGPLQDNGGPTLTCMPQADSPAINAGLNALITNPPFDGPPFYDQRGPDFVRIYDDVVDIGAVERQLPPDTTPPVITLLGDPLVSHECGVPYTDAGATAEDDIDGDITADIQVTGTVDSATPGVYTLTYNVSDSSGNPATPVSRTVTVEDTTPPQITLIGDPLVSHECHTPYTDAGATASDTCDTALPAVTIDTAAVNTDVPGTYTVSFSVTDAAGNSAPLVSRTVQVTDTLP
ncbi:MAG TPA: DUF5011 domain-containing protein, partial [Candidatus Hydrogenedentes bacterium]|nr:DUF5011 domain-containing protein [Candidatus Hydrogenedentota bacterium]